MLSYPHQCLSACIDEVQSWMQSDRLQLIPVSRSYSGVPLLAGGTNFQAVHSGLGLIPSFRQWLCVILAFISTLTSACRCTSSNLLRVASLSYVSYAASVDLFSRPHISRWLLPLFYRGWITVMRHWPASRPLCSTVSSLSSKWQLG